jgi:hypothetical protein
MSDKKTQADPQQAKAASEEQSAWTMPFSEMMEKMMAHCGCRPEPIKAMWPTCCCMPAEQKEDQKTG